MTDESFDAWGTLDDNLFKVYGKDKQSNKHNHSVVMSVRVDPTFNKQVKKVVDSKVTPHEDVSQFIRDWIQRGLNAWQAELQDPGLTAYCTSEREKMRMDDALEDFDSAEDVLAHHRERLDKALEVGNASRLMLLIGFTEEDALTKPKPFDQKLRDLAEEFRVKLRTLSE